MSVENSKDIYSMKLHKSIEINKYIVVTRVPGGWIYHFPVKNVSVFVPFDGEFNS